MKIAFICTHNACRSQIAEAFGRALLPENYEVYSAGSAPDDKIDPNVIRLMKEHYHLDLSQQYPKTIQAIPSPDIAISMGCEVHCPFIGRAFDDNWHIEDPMGRADEDYLKAMRQIRTEVQKIPEKYPAAGH